MKIPRPPNKLSGRPLLVTFAGVPVMIPSWRPYWRQRNNYSTFSFDIFSLIRAVVAFCFTGQFKKDQLGDPGILLQTEREGVMDYQKGLAPTRIARVPDGHMDTHPAAQQTGPWSAQRHHVFRQMHDLVKSDD